MIILKIISTSNDWNDTEITDTYDTQNIRLTDGLVSTVFQFVSNVHCHQLFVCVYGVAFTKVFNKMSKTLAAKPTANQLDVVKSFFKNVELHTRKRVNVRKYCAEDLVFVYNVGNTHKQQ